MPRPPKTHAKNYFGGVRQHHPVRPRQSRAAAAAEWSPPDKCDYHDLENPFNQKLSV